MYRQEDARQYVLENFYLPFGGHLDSENRWGRLTKLIPWEEFEEEYSHHFTEEWKGGIPAKPFRTASGAILIKEKLRISDNRRFFPDFTGPYIILYLF